MYIKSEPVKIKMESIFELTGSFDEINQDNSASSEKLMDNILEIKEEIVIKEEFVVEE